MNMDKKTAFEILNLDSDVTLEDAKKAYRNLAKKYHPDVMEKHPWSEKRAESKMKEINIAFRYLTPLLRSDHLNSGQLKPDEAIKETKKKNVSFSFLSRMFDILLNTLEKKEDNRVFENRNKKDKPLKKSKVRFDDVLKSKTGKNNKKRYSQNKKPCNGYQKYMELKRKMKSGRPGRDQNMSIGRVEKIDPVKPVNPVH